MNENPITFESSFANALFEAYGERSMMLRSAQTRLVDALNAVVNDRNRFNVSQQRRIRVEPGRIKEPARLLAKVQSPKYDGQITNPFDVFHIITDIVATRVTCNTVEDVHAVARAITGSSTLDSPSELPEGKCYEDYIQKPKPSGYRAVHLLVNVEVPFGSNYQGVTCEVQVRTLLQHAWGELTHEDTFKPGVRLPSLVTALSKRLATALAVLDEIAQDLRDELAKIEEEEATSSGVVVTKEGEGRPVPRPNLRESVLREVFHEIIGRPLSVPRRELAALRQHLAFSGLADRQPLRDALKAAFELSTGVFERYPVLLTDHDLLDAATQWPRGQSGVREALTKAAQQLSSRLDTRRQFEELYQPGRAHVGTAIRVQRRYALIQLTTGENAILSTRHLEQGEPVYLDLEDFISPGDSLRVEVVNSDTSERRIEVRPIDQLERARPNER